MPLPPVTSGLIVALQADTLGLADGAAVASWTDQSGLGNHFVQAVGANQPRVRNFILGGRTAVNFNTDDFLTRSLTFGPFTVFLVMREHTGGAAPDTAPTDHSLDATNGHWLRTSGTDTIAVRRGGVLSDKNAAALWAEVNRTQRIAHVFDGTHAGHLLYLNGSLVALADVAAGNPGAGVLTRTFFLGSFGGGSAFINAEVGEVLIYNRALSAGEIGQVDGYLATKWAVRQHVPALATSDLWNTGMTEEEVGDALANPAQIVKAMRREDLGDGIPRFTVQATDWGDVTQRIWGLAREPATLFGDAYAYLNFQGTSDSVITGSYVRGLGGPNAFRGYVVLYHSAAAPRFELRRWDGGTLRDKTQGVLLGTFDGALSQTTWGDALMIRAVGTTIELIEIGNGAMDAPSRISVVDATYSTGEVGAVAVSAGGGVNAIQRWLGWEAAGIPAAGHRGTLIRQRMGAVVSGRRVKKGI